MSVAWASDLTVCSLTFGPYLTAAGDIACAGVRGRIVPSTLIRDNTGAVIVDKPIPVVLDTAGTATVTLLHTDQATLNPHGFTYSVRWDTAYGVPRLPAGSFALPQSVGSSADFDALAPTPPSAGVLIPVGVGPQGPTGAQGPQGVQGPAGQIGLTGAAGAPGPAGPAGPQGVTGPVGPVGPAGLRWRGTWSAVTAYAVDDAVFYDGSSWWAVSANSGVEPVEGVAQWQPLAARGAAGPTGATGAAGARGETGPAGAVGATGATGAQGPQGVQGVKGDTGAAGATGAQGPKGDTGAAGAQGPAGAAGAAAVLPLWDFLDPGELTVPRGHQDDSGSYGSTPPSGAVRLTYFYASKTASRSSLRFQTGGTAAASSTVARAGIYVVNGDGSLTLVASCANKTTFGGTYATQTCTFTTAVTLTAGQLYAVGVLSVASTPPSLLGVWFNSGFIGATPKFARQVSGQSDLPASITSGFSDSNFPVYCEVL